MDSALTPTMLIDFSKYRIRLHSSTLHRLSNPGYIMLLVNPEKNSLAVTRCDRLEKGSHKVRFSHPQDKYCELYSRPLMKALLSICPGWGEGKSYKMEGKAVEGRNIIVFSLDNYTILEGDTEHGR